jgi:hypothetical protein
VVHLPDDGVLAMGDLIEEAAPWLGGAWIPGWAAFLVRARSLEAGIVLPSHGAVQRDRVLLDWQAAFFDALVAQADLLVSEGRTAEDMMLSAPLERFRADFASVGVEAGQFDTYVRNALAEAMADVREGR